MLLGWLPLNMQQDWILVSTARFLGVELRHLQFPGAGATLSDFSVKYSLSKLFSSQSKHSDWKKTPGFDISPWCKFWVIHNITLIANCWLPIHWDIQWFISFITSTTIHVMYYKDPWAVFNRFIFPFILIAIPRIFFFVISRKKMILW